MKKLIILICVISLTSCLKKEIENRDFEQQIQLVGKVEFNDQIHSFVLDFMESLKNPDCIYEIYIDKKTEDEYFLTLFNEPNEPNYLSNRFPVNYTLVNGKYVFIYSGLEDFLNKESYKPNISIADAINKEGFEANTISMVISKDTSYIAGDIGIPFSEIKIFPPVKFEPPKE